MSDQNTTVCCKKVLVAALPPMKKKDYIDFEHSVPIFGEQRQIRRKQLQVASIFAGFGGIYPLFLLKQTYLVRLLLAPTFALFGIIIGDFVGRQIYPSIADNRETSMIRTLWWARECSKSWKYDTSRVRDPLSVDLTPDKF